MTPNEATEKGYCIVCTQSPILIARIDRPDWREHMADVNPKGNEWVMMLASKAAHHYRKHYSKDVLVVAHNWIGQVPKSEDGPLEFVA